MTYLGTSMYIGPHTCMSGYVSAYHGVGKLCIRYYVTQCRCRSFIDRTPWSCAPYYILADSMRMMYIKNELPFLNTGSVRTGHFFCRTFRKLIGKKFLATRVAFLDSPSIAEIVYVIFNLVARLMLDLYAL